MESNFESNWVFILYFAICNLPVIIGIIYLKIKESKELKLNEAHEVSNASEATNLDA